jgi:hypothetical protein
MPKISTYPIAQSVTLNDYLLGTQVQNANDTKNFLLSDIQTLFGGGGGGGGAVNVTKAELDALITAGDLVPGTYYIISGVDVNLYGGTTVLIQAATTNTLNLAGHGIFYNPKYLNSAVTPTNGFGVWYNYIEFVYTDEIDGTFEKGETVITNTAATGIYIGYKLIQYISGDWLNSTSIEGQNSEAFVDIEVIGIPIYNESDTVIWGGKKWINNTGSVGLADNKYTLSEGDWTPVEFNSTDYNVVADVIHYDYEHDMIIRRKDKFNNDVDGNYIIFSQFEDPDDYDFGNPIKDFQWGNGTDNYSSDNNNYYGVISNYVKDSYLECINFVGNNFSNNTLTNTSYMWGNIFGIDGNTSRIIQNTLNKSNLSENVLMDGGIDNNYLESGSEISGNQLFEQSRMESNKLSSGSINTNFLLTSCYINNNSCTNGNIYTNNLNNECSFNGNIVSNNSEIKDNSINNFFNFYFNNLNYSIIEYNNGSNGSITQNSMDNSTIAENSFNVGSIGLNSLTNSDINNNTVTEDSVINNNNLIGNSSINYNVLGTNTNMNYNSLFQSFISNNTILSDSFIQENTLSNSNMGSNTLSNTSGINKNSVFNDSSISSSVLNNSSYINNNTLDGFSQIFGVEGDTGLVISYCFIKKGALDLVSTPTLSSKSITNKLIYATVNVDLTSATYIFQTAGVGTNVQIFINGAGLVKLGYYNASNVFTVVNVNA